MGRCAAALLAAAAVAACSADAERTRDEPITPVVVAVAATPCDRPLPRTGVGMVVGPDTILTARHVVEGPLRRLAVDGRDGVVVDTDPRLDIAVVSVAGLAPAGVAPPWGDVAAVAGDAAITGPDTTRTIGIDRTVRLTVVDHTDGTEFRRDSHVLTRSVPAGSSGSPVIGGGGVLGVVTLTVPGAEESHAVTADEIERFLTRAEDTGGIDREHGAPGTC